MALEVRGHGVTDQLHIVAADLALDALSPGTPLTRRQSLPVQLAVVVPRADGNFTLDVTAFADGIDIGAGQALGFIQPGQHGHAIAELGALSTPDLGDAHADLAGVDLASRPDLAGIDLAGIDLAGAPPNDLAAVDLAGIGATCTPATGAACGGGHKCRVIGDNTAECGFVTGNQLLGQSCNSATDDCAPGFNCPIHNGEFGFECRKLCNIDSNCSDTAPIAGIADSTNRSTCADSVNEVDPAVGNLCTIVCDPLNPSVGCPANTACYLSLPTQTTYRTDCTPPGQQTDGQECLDICAPGLKCFSINGSGVSCRKVCRIGHNEDCQSPETCSGMDAGGTGGGKFGACCPAAGC